MEIVEKETHQKLFFFVSGSSCCSCCLFWLLPGHVHGPDEGATSGWHLPGRGLCQGTESGSGVRLHVQNQLVTPEHSLSAIGSISPSSITGQALDSIIPSHRSLVLLAETGWGFTKRLTQIHKIFCNFGP